MEYAHSFALAAYGTSPYLEDCVKSLLAQSVPSEIYIATGTPNAHIYSLGAKYGIRVYANPKGGGIGKDWNFALSKATTPYVTIAHQDDFYAKNYTKSVLEAFMGKPASAIAFTGYHELRNGKVAKDNLNLIIKRTLLFPFRLMPNALTQRLALLFGSAICCPSVAFNRHVLDDDFTFDETMGSNLDWKKWIELSNAGKPFAYIPKALMLHRIHSGSATTEQIKSDNRSREDREIFELLWPKPIAAGISAVYRLSQSSNKE